MLSKSVERIQLYFLAKFRFDTAENEPAKNLQNFRKMHFRKMHFRKMHFRKMHFRKSTAQVRHRVLRARLGLAQVPAVRGARAGFGLSVSTSYMGVVQLRTLALVA